MLFVKGGELFFKFFIVKVSMIVYTFGLKKEDRDFKLSRAAKPFILTLDNSTDDIMASGYG